MNRVMRSLLAVPLLSLLVTGPAAADATLRKCTENNLTDSPFIAGKVMVMINGEIVGEMYPGAVRVAYIDGDVVRAAPEDILHMQVTCLEYVTDSGPVVTQVVSVVTRKGAERLARQYLRELPALQVAYRQEHGRFADSVEELRFFIRRAPLPLVVNATATGWTASISQPGIICSASGSQRGATGAVCVDPSGNVVRTGSERSLTRAILRTSTVPSLTRKQ